MAVPIHLWIWMMWTSKVVLCSWDRTCIRKRNHQLLLSRIRSLLLGLLNITWCTNQCHLSCADCVMRLKKLLFIYCQPVLSLFWLLTFMVAAVVHWHLMKVHSFPMASQSWCSHKSPPVLESSVAKILWDFTLQTVHNHDSNRPDIVLFAYQQKQIYFIEISCPADINVISKEEKLLKYQDLATDYQQMYGMPVTIILVVFGCMGVVSSRCLDYIKKIPEFSPRLFGKRQSLEPFTSYEPLIYDWLLSYVLYQFHY